MTPRPASDDPAGEEPEETLPWWPEARPRSVGEPLTRDRIITGALELLQQEGGDALTMRRLAAHLAVSPSTIYWWVEGREHLLALVVDAVHGLVRRSDQPTRPVWADELRRLSVGLYEAYRDNPAVLPVLAGGVLAGPNTIALFESFLAVLVNGAGLPPREASGATRAIQALVRGFIPQPSAVPGSVEAKVWTAGAGLGALPADRFPLLAGLAEDLESMDPAEEFAWALDAFISSLVVR